MGLEKMVNDLYKFLKTDVTDKSLFEASDKAYKSDVVYLKESRLPADPSQIKTPMEDVQLMTEKEKEESGEVNPAEMTDEVSLSKVEKEANEKTPNVDKLSDFKNAAKVQTKESRKAAFLKKMKEARKVKEGKLPADLSQIKNPNEEVYQLAENEVEAPLTSLPDEETAKSVVNKVGVGKSRYEKNDKGQFVVYTKEAKAGCKGCGVTDVKVVGAKDPKDVLKKQQESKKIKEETTTEPAITNPAQVPDVKDKKDVDVDVTPIVNANPDNKDNPTAVAGEVNNGADVNKVTNANPDNKDKGTVVKEETITGEMQSTQGADKGEQQTQQSKSVSKGAPNSYVGKAGSTTAGDKPKDIDPVSQGADDGEKQTQKSQSTSNSADNDYVGEKKLKEETTTEPTKGEVKAATKVPEVDAETKTDVNDKSISNANPDNKDKKNVIGVAVSTDPTSKVVSANPNNKDKEGIVAEEVAVTVNTDGKEVEVTQDDSGATTVTTNPTASSDVITDVAPVGDEVIGDEAEDVFDGEDELVPEELEVAEKLFLVDHLSSKKKLSERETKFIKETRGIKLPKSAWERVHAKVAQLKGNK